MTAEAIDSVLAQTFTDFELIVVDDGSTDGTAAVVERYGGRVVSLRQDNRGVSAARNRGLDEARGEFIALLDSDDLWMPAKLEAQMRFFRQNEDAVICQTQETWVRGGRRVNPKAYHAKQSGDIFAVSLERCMVSPSAVMFRRSLTDVVGRFDERLPACEDYDLWLRVSCRFPVHLIDEQLIVKRGGRPDQLSACIPALDRYRIEAIRKLLAEGVLTPEQHALAHGMLVHKARIYLNGCKKRGNVQEAERIEALMKEAPVFAGAAYGKSVDSING